MTDSIDKWRQVRLKVWGEYACFTRPEMKVERVSYDVMTPSAARGILEAVLWKPAIRWIVERIDVLAPIRTWAGPTTARQLGAALAVDPRPIRFASVRRNEVGCVFSNKEGIFVEDNRQQRAGADPPGCGLPDPGPVRADPGGRRRRTAWRSSPTCSAAGPAKGQCFHRPYLGCREFPASFELVDFDREPPEPVPDTRDLGWMFYDFAYGKDPRAMFFRAGLDRGPDEYP